MDTAKQHVSHLLKNDVIYNVIPSKEFGMAHNIQKIYCFLGQMHISLCIHMRAHTHTLIYIHTINFVLLLN